MKQVVAYPKPKQKEAIEKAAAMSGLKTSAFIVSASYMKANQIIKNNSPHSNFSITSDGEQGNSPSLCSTPINHTQGVSFPEGAASPSAHSQLNPKVPAQ